MDSFQTGTAYSGWEASHNNSRLPEDDQCVLISWIHGSGSSFLGRTVLDMPFLILDLILDVGRDKALRLFTRELCLLGRKWNYSLSLTSPPSPLFLPMETFL